jgi:3-methyladenine DNA glycosylase AlkD
MTVEQVLAELRALATDADREGMKRFAIDDPTAFGVRTPELQKLAKRLGVDHALALRLWRTGQFEAKAVGARIADPAKMTPALMDRWAADLRSWADCDNACFYLFDKTPYAWTKALAWAARDEEFVKRAGFAVMAALAIHDKAVPDARFAPFFAAAKRAATDNRNFVKKAVSWALRQMGKRNAKLRDRALKTAEQIAKIDAPAARWIASDVRRELRKLNRE